MYERASNAHVNFFLAWVKSGTNSTLFCRESKFCCNSALIAGILMAFNQVTLTLKIGGRKVWIT